MRKIQIAITAVLLSALFYSCKKDTVQVIDESIDASTPKIKYFNFGVNTPSVNFYANNVKVSAALSATGVESTAGVNNGSVYPASNYSLLSAGAYTFEARLPSTVTTDANLSINSFNGMLESNKSYSFYLCGLYTAKKADAFIVEDKLPPVDNNKAYVRFVNTVPNATSNMSLFVHDVTAAAGTDLPVATGIAYKGASEFVAVPVGVYELYARYPSAPTVNVISRNGTSTVAFVGGRVYTIGSRGDITVSTAGTATNRPLIDVTSNR
jgi:hypothetical protein